MKCGPIASAASKVLMLMRLHCVIMSCPCFVYNICLLISISTTLNINVMNRKVTTVLSECTAVQQNKTLLTLLYGWVLGVITYHSWAGIRDFSLEGDPLVVGPLFVSKGPQKGPPDVIHGVETHS